MIDASLRHHRWHRLVGAASGVLALLATACASSPTSAVDVADDSVAQPALARPTPTAEPAPTATTAEPDKPTPAPDEPAPTATSAPAATAVPTETPPSDDARNDGVAAPAAATATVALPSIDVVDLIAGGTTNLGDVATPGATLLWFWAPH